MPKEFKGHPLEDHENVMVRKMIFAKEVRDLIGKWFFAAAPFLGALALALSGGSLVGILSWFK